MFFTFQTFQLSLLNFTHTSLPCAATWAGLHRPLTRISIPAYFSFRMRAANNQRPDHESANFDFFIRF